MRGEVIVPAVDRSELAPIDGNNGLGKQIKLLSHEDKAFADIADSFAVVMPKVGDGLEVRCQPSREPH